jgi:hypothetical protein
MRFFGVALLMVAGVYTASDTALAQQAMRSRLNAPRKRKSRQMPAGSQRGMRLGAGS